MMNKYSEANNKYMEDYDEDMDNTLISYLDANNLYGHAMNRPLPYKDFKWIDSISIDTIMNYDESSDVGYTLEVDLHYPKELHDLHNDCLYIYMYMFISFWRQNDINQMVVSVKNCVVLFTIKKTT